MLWNPPLLPVCRETLSKGKIRLDRCFLTDLHSDIQDIDGNGCVVVVGAAGQAPDREGKQRREQGLLPQDEGRLLPVPRRGRRR